MVQNIFGTDGVRGHFGENYLSITHTLHLGFALGKWLHANNSNTIFLAQDTRISKDTLQATISVGILSHQISIIHGGVTSIGALQAALLLAQKNTAQSCYGIMLSASHNPWHDNGIKIISATGKLDKNEELIISELFHEVVTKNTFAIPDKAKLGTIEYQDFNTIYRDFLLKKIPALYASPLKIVLDCANGALSTIAPTFFTQLGHNVVALFTEPNGTNINDACGATHVTPLQKAVLEHSADVGFAFDGDGDRLIAVNRHGVIKNGDHLLALMLEHPLCKDTPGVVGTIMSNGALQEYVLQKRKQFTAARVGDRAVIETMRQTQWILGGEPSGHLICHAVTPISDGLMAAYMITQVMHLTHNKDLETFTPFYQYNTALPTTDQRKLANEEINTIINTYKQHLLHGSIVIRYSGTEPLLRIMVEDRDEAHAINVATMITKSIKEKIHTHFIEKKDTHDTAENT